MSWLGSLAAKTENLLNKVDQVAGQALQTPEKNETFNQFPTTRENLQESQTFSKESKQIPQNLINDFSLLKRNNSSTKLSKDIKKDPEAELFEFLNNSQNPTSCQSSQISVPTQATSETTTSLKSEKQQQVEKPKISPNATKTSTTDDSSILRENQLLKDEMHSLNRELMSILARGKSANEEYQKVCQKLETERKIVSQKDATIREYKEREADGKKTMQAKDSQLSVLRVRLQEADLELNAKVKLIDKFQSEKNNILEDHSLSTGAQSQALDSLHARLKEMEGMLKSEEDKKNKIETRNRELMAGLETTKSIHAAEITDLLAKLTTQKTRCSELQTQMKLARSQADANKQELVQYKQKATRILHSKEKLIGKLKESSLTDASGASEPTLQVTEMESLRSERDILREELTSNQMSLETVKAEYADLEMQSEQDMDGAREEMNVMSEKMAMEWKRRRDVEAELAAKMSELKYLHEELLSQKSSFQGKLSEKEADLTKLKNQVMKKCTKCACDDELEGRLHSLTESLIHKQTHLEALSSEKNSLVLQLERLEKQHREAEFAATRKSSSSNININDDDDSFPIRSRFPNLMPESPFDGKVARNVKKAANSIDRFSMRLGLFLRRYPFVRVFIIIYMVLLHLWVMVLLLTYEPEAHNADYTFPHLPPSNPL